MRILVLGASGMLGHKLMQRLAANHEMHGTIRASRNAALDRVLPGAHIIPGVSAEDFDSVIRALAEVHPDVVLNCIGIVKQLAAGKLPIPSIATNALFPHRLAQACKAAGARLIHFSTDCVYSGEHGMNSEADLQDARDLYGLSKLLGETGEDEGLTIRSSIIGRELAGSSHGLLEWFASQAGGKVRGFRHAIYTGFTTIEMANIVEKVIQDAPALSGVYQVASPPINKFDLLVLVDKAMAYGTQIESDEVFKSDRSLDGSRFAAEVGYTSPSWEAMIDAFANDPTEYTVYE